MSASSWDNFDRDAEYIQLERTSFLTRAHRLVLSNNSA